MESRFTAKRYRLDKDTLRNAGIDVLINDERWNGLFKTIEKTPAILKAENEMRKYLEEKTRLHMEYKMNAAEKQSRVNRIMELGQFAHNGGEPALLKMNECEARLSELNEAYERIKLKESEIDGKLTECSLSTLEGAIAYLYRTMKRSKARVGGLDMRIAGMRETLKERISERETLAASVSDTYFFLHGLLGVDIIDPLDDHYKNEKQ